MNRGSYFDADGNQGAEMRFNEAPIHESGKLCLKSGFVPRTISLQ